MSDEPDSLVLRYLRRLDAKVDKLGDLLSDLSAEMRAFRAHQVGSMQTDLAHDGQLASIRDRLDKVERRLDLREQDA